MDAEAKLKGWAQYVESTYPDRIAAAKSIMIRNRAIGIALYGLIFYLESETNSHSFINFILFVIGSFYLSISSNASVKYFERGQLRVAKLMGRGDYASVITWQSIADRPIDFQRRYQDLRAAGIDLYERSTAEREAREAEGLDY